MLILSINFYMVIYCGNLDSFRNSLIIAYQPILLLSDKPLCLLPRLVPHSSVLISKLDYGFICSIFLGRYNKVPIFI
jgi:hypothetical protein